MIELQRITQLTSPPVVGQRYLVPTVTYPWLGDRPDRFKAWPVFLPKHNDADHLKFVHQHYHVDPRFLTKAQTRYAGTYYWHEHTGGGDVSEAEATAQRAPLFARGYPVHPPVVWLPRRCYRANVTYHYGDEPKIESMRAHYAGRQCAKSRGGWLCPHKRFPLGSLQPDQNGVVTCPLHGLQIDMSTGVVLGPRIERAAA